MINTSFSSSRVSLRRTQCSVGRAMRTSRPASSACQGKAQERDKPSWCVNVPIKVKDREHAGLRHGFVGNHIGHKYVLAEIHILFRISLPALPSQSLYQVAFFPEPWPDGSKDVIHHAAVNAQRRAGSRGGRAWYRHITIFATSSTVAARWITELGRFAITNSFASCSSDLPVLSISSFIIAAKPSDIVGPGSTLFTVTPLPATNFARPRASESWAVFVTP